MMEGLASEKMDKMLHKTHNIHKCPQSQKYVWIYGWQTQTFCAFSIPTLKR